MKLKSHHACRQAGKSKVKSCEGFTLIEALIYIAIIGGVMATFISFGLSIAGNRNKVYATQEVQANMRVALDIISQKIKTAEDVDMVSSTFAGDPGVLVLITDNPNTNPTIINLNEDNGRLQIKQGDSEYVYITADKISVSNLVFSNYTGDSPRKNIGINIMMEYSGSDDSSFYAQQELNTAVSLRQ